MNTQSFTGDLKKFSDKTGIELEVVVRKIAFDIYRGITEKTPVLTGRAKGNWNIGLGRINNSINESATSTPKGSAGKLKIPLKGAGLKSIYITNNLPYIYTLEYGNASRTPNNMVSSTMNETARMVRNVIR
tara:strand:+ start:1009 stop:1401 length:393 start_codon:yes stop_codon:yes gene_type:complete